MGLDSRAPRFTVMVAGALLCASYYYYLLALSYRS